jgi:hypothetical protein
MANTEDRHIRDTQPISRHRAEPDQKVDSPDIGAETESLDVAQEGQAEGQPWAEDKIPTPVPMDVLPGPPRPRGSWLMRLAVIVALLVALASLALNVLLISNLLAARQTFVDGVDQAIAALETLNLEGFRYDFHIQQTVPFEGDIPFQQDLVFPFEGNVPIKTTVTVPINAGVLGTFNIDVPIDTNIPVDIEVPVHVDETFHVETAIPLDMTVPIFISPDDPAIQKLIGGLRDWLLALRASF